MITKEIDVLLLDDEAADDVVALLEERFGVTAGYSDEQYNSSVTISVTGTEDQLRRVKHWHNASHAPRPDLRGKAPVGKGEKRTTTEDQS